jgi:hypothetical protein
MYCVNCGQKIADDSLFCPYCGTPSLDPQVTQVTTKEDVQSVETYTAGQPKTYNKNRKVLITIIIIVCIFAFLFYICPKYIGVQVLPFDPFGVLKTEYESTDNADPVPLSEPEPSEPEPSEPELSEPEPSEKEPIKVEHISTSPKFTEYFASSERKPMTSGGSVIEYGAELAFDGDWATAWCEGADGPGIGEWIEMRAESPQRVCGILILNGYYKSEDLYLRNNSISKLKVVTDEGERSYSLLQGTDGFQEILFDQPVETKCIRLVIEDVYLGSMNGVKNADDEDTLISEIKVF